MVDDKRSEFGAALLAMQASGDEVMRDIATAELIARNCVSYAGALRASSPEISSARSSFEAVADRLRRAGKALELVEFWVAVTSAGLEVLDGLSAPRGGRSDACRATIRRMQEQLRDAEEMLDVTETLFS
jgi:hypothetical protein